MSRSTNGALVLVALVLILVLVASNDPLLEDLWRRLHAQAILREVGRVYSAFHELRAHLALTRWEFGLGIATLVLLAGGAVAFLGWLWSQASLLLRRNLSKRQGILKASASSLHMQTDNKVTKARFANWLELFTVVSIQ
jgi:hypothetical protein